ncbi:outer membrane beta-barrel protein [Helicobacter didelphidarum]|uniref:outer membrane beta-barrel protein n=1 Tax=Helicobacter didelphidarum TaxID=2040648 RepID=UPI0015F133C0|nr:outer membrane beta-barrel protein [Helicobacter didelphidarum]
MGYSHYFGSLFGVRGYVDYNYGFNIGNTKTTENNVTTNINNLSSLHNITFNVDALINFYNSDSISFGAFAGIGVGYGLMNSNINEQNVQTTTKVADGFILPVNLGLSLIAGGKHRIDLTMKIPCLGLKHVPEPGQGGGGGDPIPTETQITRMLIGTIGYSYTF